MNATMAWLARELDIDEGFLERLAEQVRRDFA
jgi:hypothetical protein